MTKRHKLPLALAALGLVLAALAAWLAAGPAQAQTNSIWIDPPSATVAPGGSVNVDILAEAPALGIGSYQVDVDYDQAVLNATACTGPPPGFACAVTTPGTVTAGGFTATPLTGGQTLGTITFNAVGREGDSSPLTISVIDFNDGNGDPTSPGTAGGAVTVSEVIGGPQSSTPTAAATSVPGALPPGASSDPTAAAPGASIDGEPAAGAPPVSVDAEEEIALLNAGAGGSSGGSFPWTRLVWLLLIVGGAAALGGGMLWTARTRRSP